MPFTKFVEIGRAVYINYGKDKGKLAVVIDILNEKRVLIDGPDSGVERQIIPVRRLTLTKFKVPMLRGLRTGVLRKAISKFGLVDKWNKTGAAQKLEAKKKRRNLSDFDRFKVMVLKKQLSNGLKGKVTKLRKEKPIEKKPAAPAKVDKAPAAKKK